MEQTIEGGCEQHDAVSEQLGAVSKELGAMSQQFGQLQQTSLCAMFTVALDMPANGTTNGTTAAAPAKALRASGP